MGKPLVIYHANCQDGWASAWTAWRKLKDNADFVSAHYGDKPPDCTGREVYMLDFSCKRPVLLEMAKQANFIVVLDHHVSAQEDLVGDTNAVPVDLTLAAHGAPNVRIKFDINESGATLSWNHFFPGDNQPWPVRYAKDRDLWLWKLPHSKEINAYLASEEKSFAKWNELALLGSSDKAWRDMIGKGEAILRYQQQLIDSIVANARETEIDGHKVLIANTPVLQSEVANKLAERRPFGVTYFENKAGEIVVSLRSTEYAENVASLARKFGGGGHTHASAFKITDVENKWKQRLSNSN